MEQVCRAIRRVDRAFSLHSLQLFHREPRPHVSLLWALGSMPERLQAAIDRVHARGCGHGAALQGQAWDMAVTRVECRTGERVHMVWEHKAG